MAAPSHTAALFHGDTRRKVLLWVTDKLRDLNPEAIVVSGQSGMLIGTLVSDRLNIPLVVVRKADEETVAYSFRGDAEEKQRNRVNWFGERCYKRWVWLDDILCSGGTYRYARDMATEAGAVQGAPAAIVLYAEYKEQESYRGVPIIRENFSDHVPSQQES